MDALERERHGVTESGEEEDEKVQPGRSPHVLRPTET